MAQNVSSAIEARYRFPKLAHLHFKIKTSDLRSRWRETARKIMSSSVCDEDAGTAVITNAFEESRERYQNNHWAYLEEFWDPAFHEKLVTHWPPSRFFRPIRYITKSYDMGMMWSHKGGDDPDFLRQFPAYEAAYNLLRSKEMCKRITQQAGDGIERACYQIILTRAYWGSNVVPHIDASNRKENINLIIFVDGTGGPRGGGLGFWRDNEFREKIFEPYNLRNTCVYYDMSEAFYHGFEPMRFGTFRWTINATYCAVGT